MKSIPVFSSDWMNVSDPERNQIVFQNRNRDFGAYQIRKDYNRTLFLSLIIASLFFVGIPAAVNLLSSQKDEIIPARQILQDEIYMINILPVDPLRPAEIIKPETPAQSTPDNTIPVVVDETVLAKPTEQPTVTAETGTPNETGPSTSEKTTGTETQNITPPDIVPDNTIYKAVQEMPLFPGGEEEMFRFLMKNINYPEEDKLIRNQGTVFVYFVIDKNGAPTDIKVMNPRKGKENLEKEAMRVIGKMPRWVPGKQNGKPALVSFTLPVRFVSN